MKDYFSGHSKLYATFRPTYPVELYSFILKHVQERQVAWDCATGNGQVAGVLADYFKNVEATDISQQQLDEAIKQDNIHYSISPAEKTNFKDDSFDLITVAQALHWFKRDEFFNEVKRVGREGGLIAVWGYEISTVNEHVDEIFMDYYQNIVGPYWDPARKLVENRYKDIEFPFELISTPEFFMEVKWTLNEYMGYLSTWSATQKYIKEKGQNPIDKILPSMKALWHEDETRTVRFPLFIKLGRVK